jgi:DNA polymerase III subunit delta'
MTIPEEFPWLEAAWQRLGHYIDSARIPQALLIAGPAGLGKLRLAEAFARRLLCSAPRQEACGACSACRLLAAQTHPDFLLISPAEPGKGITVDAVRALVSTVALKPQYGGHRVVLLTPAHLLNVSAANSLLKTLEEPDERTLMLLVTDAPASLPATILSRCQRLDVGLPDPRLARQWLAARLASADPDALLAMARGAPLRALSLQESGMLEQREAFFEAWRSCLKEPLRALPVAERWHKTACEQVVDWMVGWTIDLIRLWADPVRAEVGSPDLRPSLQTLAEKLNSRELFGHLDLLQGTRRALAGQANKQLALEEILIRWSELDETS